jgi:anti-sigma factor RsiW
MKCSDFVVLIARKLDGTLPERETGQLEAHLSACSRCRAELVLQKKLIHSLKKEIPGRLSGDFTRRVTERAAELAGEERRRRFRLADLLTAIPIAAVATLLIVFGKDLAVIMAPAMEVLADTTGGPLAALGNRVADALAASSAFSDTTLPVSGVLARVFANMYVGITIACAAVVWAFSKAYTFVRE